jgi:hypothetical protein
MKNVQVTEEAFRSQKRPSNTSKHELLKFFSSFVGHFCPPKSGSGPVSTDQILVFYHPGSGTQNNKKVEREKLVVLPFFFCSHPQISQNYNYFILEQTQKIIEPIYKESILHTKDCS